MSTETALLEIATSSGPLGSLAIVLFVIGRGWYLAINAKLDKALANDADFEKRITALEHARRPEAVPTVRLEGQQV